MSNSFEITLERVKDEIRAEADAIRMRLPASRAIEPSALAAAPIAAAFDAPREAQDRLDYTIDALCMANYAQFVEEAFRAIIKREIEADTRSALVRRLAAGISKVEVLGDLRYSPEGQAAGTRIAGLRRAYLLAKLFHVPVIGFLAESAFRLLRLPVQARQQRAVETYQAGREHELRDRCTRLEKRCESLLIGQAALSERLAALAGGESSGVQELLVLQARHAEQLESVSRRLTTLADDNAAGLREAVTLRDARAGQLQERIDELARCIDEVALRAGDGNADYHRMVLGMNHWLTSLRANLGEISASHGAPARKSD